jgi:hypothetical protein
VVVIMFVIQNAIITTATPAVMVVIIMATHVPALAIITAAIHVIITIPATIIAIYTVIITAAITVMQIVIIMVIPAHQIAIITTVTVVITSIAAAQLSLVLQQGQV